MKRAVLLLAIVSVAGGYREATADEPLARTIWRRVEVAPGQSVDYEVAYEVRLPMVVHTAP